MTYRWPLIGALILLAVYAAGCGGAPPDRYAPGGGMMGSGMGSGMMGSGMGSRMMGSAPRPYDGGPAPANAGEEIPADAVVINMRQLRFVPGTLQVKPGTKVVFVNRDAYPHRVVQSTVKDLGKGAASFTSPILNAGGTWSYTFTEPGRFAILCDVAGHHLAGMVGVVEVTAE